MPSYKNETKTKNKWYCSFYYKDYQGNNKKKKKEGFATKREADEWERSFLASVTYSPEMHFSAMYNNYIDDMRTRLKEYTILTKLAVYEKHIAPYFKDIPIKDITPIMIRKWQNELIGLINDKTGKPYSQTYLKAINNQLVACFNYAVKFHNLRENPCSKAGSMGTLKSKEMNIWSLEEFKLFNEMFTNQPLTHLGFNILYWTGMRLGEMLALTWRDIDFENQTINIDKSYQRINGKDIVTKPKTTNSIRKILVNKSVIDEIQELKNRSYKVKNTDRIIPYTKFAFNGAIKKGAEWNNLKPIRVHDLRHSHASLLLHHGVNIVAISKRLGHEKVETTLNIYSHLYPNQEDNLLNLMEDIENKIE